MTPSTRAEASAIKRCRQLEADLNWIRKRIPGRGVCDDLERIAAMLRFGDPDWSATKDAEALDGLAGRLRELRTKLRGSGGRERSVAETEVAIALGHPSPFASIIPPAVSGERVEVTGEITLTGSGPIATPRTLGAEVNEVAS